MIDSSIDKTNMYKSITDFSEHIKESFDFFKENSSLTKNYNDINNIMILGMGGSIITGLLMKELLKNDLDIPIEVNQGYNIPKWVNNKTLILACSYSGNTEETLISCEECFKKTSNVIGISKGGKLFDLLKNKASNEYVKMPDGLQPRAALGFSFSLMLILLNKLQIVGDSFIKDLKNSIPDLAEKTKVYSLKDSSNVAYSTANKIYNKNPLIYAEEGIFNIIGYRFKCQLVENSKVLAFNNAVPEMNHNEIEAYTNTVNIKDNFVVIWINDSSYHDRNTKRIKIVTNIWRNKVKEQLLLEVEENSDNKILKYLSYIHLVDWISYHAAILNKVDPSIIPNINELKKSL